MPMGGCTTKIVSTGTCTGEDFANVLEFRIMRHDVPDMTTLQFLTGMIWLSQSTTIHGRRWYKTSLSILGKWPVLTSRTITTWMRWWIQENMNQTFLNIFTWCSMCSGQYTYTLQQTVIKSSSTIFFQESNVYKSDEEYHKHRKHKGGSHKMISMLRNLTIINSLTMSLF